MKRANLVAVCLLTAVALVGASVAITWRLTARSSDPAARQDASAHVAEDQPAVYPPMLKGTKSMELGQLVVLLMPDENAKSIDWDYHVDSPIHWETAGFDQTSPNAARRVGYIRVNVQGKVQATVLRQAREELGWSVEY